ncbi:Ribose ABC transport system, ATP-binding protein RbsA [Paenibacillus pasadenensis]|uniref:Ribose ABC transport system, ATP-binding protein RbsA n=1 Tax=Paenibacillus pasadenensis TaxID=217090 RepID=A0A2N5N5P0_9BACL|nr:sugar ABC transporter ATP-binding protein [Paenibacillus pasadenensis]PLT45642.1 Ribose ABC transport system, ATP-binding protein RbsA [Paenibacillus pasadenensis]
MDNRPSRLRLSGIAKSFSGVPALHGVDLELAGGEIHALLGANGAGKSTLIKILSGAYASDRGVIELDGAAVRIDSPKAAKELGIHCVYQEVDTALVPGLSVAENIMLDRHSAAGAGFWVDWKSLHLEAAETLRRLGADIPLHKRAGELTLAEKQLVLIARLLTEQARFVVLDEPTAPLSLEEAERLFRVMEALRAEGIGIVFITHRLPEVFRLCSRVTVMRDGRRIWTKPAAETNADDVALAMLGRRFEDEYPKLDADIGEMLLEVSGLRSGSRVKGVDLNVRSGEITAVVGLVGAGKTELSRAIFGADASSGGEVRVAGKPVRTAQPADAVRGGIALVPEERRRQGIIASDTVLRNLTLPTLGKLLRGGLLSRRREQRSADGLIARLGIKTSGYGQSVSTLSGGNQQKVSIGKWIPTDASVYLFDEPTKGVDIGAKRDIFQVIGTLAQQGKAVLYLTCEFQEAIGIADRILVMYDGAIVREFGRGEASQEELLIHASGGRGGTS